MIRTYISYDSDVVNLQFRLTGNYLVQARKNRMYHLQPALCPDVSPVLHSILWLTGKW
jgi:hypothetical protein